MPRRPRPAWLVLLVPLLGAAPLRAQTGSQALEDSPYLDRGAPYWTVLVAGEKRFGEIGVFASVENLGDVRQTDFEPRTRPTRAADGRWTVDAWSSQEGRTFRVGIRLAE